MKKRIVAALLCVALIGGGGFYWYHSKNTALETYDFVTEETDQQVADDNVTEENVLETEVTEEFSDVVTADEQLKPVQPAAAYSVSSSNDLVTQTGMDVLSAGGNAVDAAIAMGYVLTVVEPYSSGLGGSGGMMIYNANTQQCVLYDYRACAGEAAELHDQVGVPGFVAGMEKIHGTYGSIALKDLIEPARYYAETGFPVYPALAARFKEHDGMLNSCRPYFNSNGELLKEGETLVQQDLADTLAFIQENGAEGFYKGKIAQDIASVTGLTEADFANYQVYVENALQGSYLGNRIYSANGPFSGLTLLQMFGLAEEIGLVDPEQDSMQYLSQLRTISNKAAADHYANISDPKFYTIDQPGLLTHEHLQSLLDDGGLAKDEDKECVETTSFTIADSNGLVVSCTNTLSSFFGIRARVDGIMLNNSMSNFSVSSVNAFQPGKRSRTYTAPTIIVKEDGTAIAIGTPGGNNIPSILFQVINDFLKNGLSYQEAIDRTRTVYRKGVLTIESDTNDCDWLDLSGVAENIVWIDKGYTWGSIALAGYSPSEGAFSAFDYRRGATMSGTHNP